MGSMVQYSVWPNCQNNCKFCLRAYREIEDKTFMIERLKELEHNIGVVDWEKEYSRGISLLGGEIFFVEDEDVKEELYRFVNRIIDLVLLKSQEARLSFVTNGIYDPNNSLFKFLDIIKERVGISRADINVSYDIKYRFSSEEKRQMCIRTINAIHERYDYCVGVQTILTQYFINAVFDKTFSISDFESNVIPGNQLTFLYPHPINPVLITKDNPMTDFQFDRKSFFKFMTYLKNNFPRKYDNFYLSVENSGVLKKTGAIDPLIGLEDAQPVLSDGKQIINEKCGHTVLYKCYTDSDKCMLCDLHEFGR